MACVVVSLILYCLEEIDPKATRIIGSTSFKYYINVPTFFWMQFYYSFGSMGDVSSLLAICSWTHIWVATIYVVNVVADVLFCVDTYVGLLPHILSWIYQLSVFVNPTLL